MLHAWRFGPKNTKEGGAGATHNKKQKMLCVKGLDTKNSKNKGGQVQHEVENKMCCVLGNLDTKNIEEGGVGATHSKKKMLHTWNFEHQKQRGRGAGSGRCNKKK
jgi:hypothetical protein